AQPFEDVQRLPEHDPRVVGSPGAESGLPDSLEDLGLLVGVADLDGHRQGGVVVIQRLVVPAGFAAHVSYPANRGQLLGLVCDLLGDRSGLLVVDQRLVVALRASVNRADTVEDLGFIREVAYAAVGGKRTAISLKALLVAALIMVDGSYVVIQD